MFLTLFQIGLQTVEINLDQTRASRGPHAISLWQFVTLTCFFAKARCAPVDARCAFVDARCVFVEARCLLAEASCILAEAMISINSIDMKSVNIIRIILIIMLYFDILRRIIEGFGKLFSSILPSKTR